MKRRLFSILSALSLLLFVAVVALWVRNSDGGYEDFAYLGPRGKRGFVGYHFGSADGALMFARIRVRGSDEVDPSEAGLRHSRGGRASLWSWSFQTQMMMLRHGVQRGQWGAVLVRDVPLTGRGRESIAGIMFPHWSAALALSAAPGLWCYRRCRRRRETSRSDGATRCVSCGDDLRATPDRCPECGAVPSNASTT